MGMRWTAIWHEGAPILPLPEALEPDRPLAETSLLLELTVPPQRGARPLRLWQGASDPRRAIGLYLMPDGAMRLVHGAVDLQSEPGFARAGETIILRYIACARGRKDVLDLRNMERQTRLRLRAGFDQPICLADALPRDLRFLEICHIAAIAPFGVAPTDLPGLAAGTRVETPDGPTPVETLRTGMRVTDATGAAAVLRWVEARPHLSLGRFAPIRLRAPYFGLSEDICVTAETRVLRRGPAVEYVCGTESVLVEARDLTCSKAARPDRTEAVQQMYHLMLDDHACVMVDRCPLETALLADVIAAEDMSPRRMLSETDKTHCVPVLNRSTAQALASVGTNGRLAKR